MKTALVLALIFVCKLGFAGEVGEDKKPECFKHKQESRKVEDKSAKKEVVVEEKKEGAKQ